MKYKAVNNKGHIYARLLVASLSTPWCECTLVYAANATSLTILYSSHKIRYNDDDDNVTNM